MSGHPPWETLKNRAFRHLSASSCPLGKVVRDLGPCTLVQAENLYDCLNRSIVSQFISTKAAQAISAKILAAMGTPVFTPQGVNKLGPEKLKNLGLSSSKARFLHGAAELWLDRKKKKLAPPSPALEEVEDLLGELPGVGPWTLDMLRIFALGKPDVLPLGDYGLKTGIAALFGLEGVPDTNILEKLAAPWAPYRSFATWYVWRSKGNVPQS